MNTARTLILALATLLSGCASPWVSRAAGSVLMPSPTVELPARRVFDFFVLTTEIQGRGPFHLLLDTGSDYLILDQQAFDRLDLRGDRPPVRKILGAYGDLSPVTAAANVDRIRCGDLELRDVPALALNLSLLEEALGGRTSIDGLLGVGPLSDLTLILDYPADRVAVSTDRIAPPNGANILATEPGNAVPIVSVRIGTMDLACLIDSGCGWNVALPRSVGGDMLAPETIRSEESVSISGAHRRTVGQLDVPIAIGSHVLRGQSAIVGPGRAKLGAPILRNFTVRLDLPSGRVSFVRASR